MASFQKAMSFCFCNRDKLSVIRTSLNTSEIISEMPDLLIVITDLWLIWFFKRICLLYLNTWIKLSKITALSSVLQKGQMYQYSKPRSAMQRLAM